MAVTKLIAVGNKKVGIGGTIDYVCNPDKTNDGEYVSGFNCTPQTAAHEFDISKIKFGKEGGRQGYHLIQSFAIGETNPEQAHTIGYYFAKELLKGRFEFVVSTHLDKQCIHNHIVFNSVSFMDGKKFHGSADIFHRIQRISDKLCLENGLSVITEKKERGKSYAEYQAERQGKSWKAKLRETIDRCVLEAKDWEEFLALMAKENYEVKHSKHISFRAEGQERFTRAKTLGSRYTEEVIKSRLSASEVKTELSESPLLIDIENNVKAQQSAGLKHWMQMKNLKIAAATINYLCDNKLLHYQTLSDKCDELKTKRNTTCTRIKEIEARIKVLKTQINDIDTYRKNKPIVEKLDTVFFKDKYKREHENEFHFFDVAKKACKKHFPDGKYPLIKSLRAELQELYSEKDKLYPEYYSAKDDLKVISAHKTNVDFILNGIAARETRCRNRSQPELE
jgi:hypothetical protein